MAPVLTRLTIADHPTGWESAGFTSEPTALGHGRIHVDGLDLVLDGEPATDDPDQRIRFRDRGIRSWGLTEVDDGVIDGLATVVAGPPGDAPTVAHANGVSALDHLVVASPDCDRTVAALGAVGIDERRTRHTDTYGAPMRQTFFRVGRPILELIGPTEPSGSGPATFWGLAFTVADLDATKDRLGDRLGDPKDAVQPGRRIATLRTRELDISVPIAFMSPDPMTP